MSKVNMEILQDIITDYELCNVQREELQKVIDKLTPYKLIYDKDGYSKCKNRCNSYSDEFDEYNENGNRNEPRELYCTVCGQKIWTCGYNGEVEMDNIVKFK